MPHDSLCPWGGCFWVYCWRYQRARADNLQVRVGELVKVVQAVAEWMAMYRGPTVPEPERHAAWMKANWLVQAAIAAIPKEESNAEEEENTEAPN